MIVPRPYQIECVEAVVAKARAGVRSQLVSLPTGAGKTLIAALVGKKFKSRTLFLVHREELADQAREKFELVWPEASVGIVMGERNEVGRDVTVASVQTLMSERRREHVAKGFGVVFVDEAHHYVSRAWEKVVRHYRGDNLLVGITATARRSDRLALGRLFQEIVYHKSLLDLIAEGYLVDILGVEVRTTVSLDGLARSGEDFDDDRLASVVNVDNRNRLIAEAYLEHGQGRKAIAFTANVKHAHDLASAMVALGIRAAAVDGTMAMGERRLVLKAFAQGHLDVLVNCALLIEGYDETSISCVILARPTKSQTLYQQAVGRGARIHPGKEDLLVIDVTDNTTQHDLVTLPTLFGIERSELGKARSVAKAVAAAQEREHVAEIRQGSGLVARPVSLFSRSQFCWLPAKGGQWTLNLASSGKVVIRPADDGGYHVFHRQGRQEQIVHPRPVPLDWAMGIAEERVRKVLGQQTAIVDRSATWRREPATAKQVELLRKMRAPVWTGMTRGDASKLLDEINAAGGPSAWWKQRRAQRSG